MCGNTVFKDKQFISNAKDGLATNTVNNEEGKSESLILEVGILRNVSSGVDCSQPESDELQKLKDISSNGVHY